jgi:mRNA interferase RelE/StbE
MAYRLKITGRAQRTLRQMPEHLASEAVDEILALADDPRPPHALAMSDQLTGRYRIRIDGWRILYLIRDADQVVTVLDVRRRTRNTYLNVP